MVFLKDQTGKVVLVVISNASGNYKPDLYSAEKLAERVQKDFSVPRDRIVVTKGEPLGVQTVKILMKARRVEAAASSARLTEMEAGAKEILESPQTCFTDGEKGTPSCARLITQSSRHWPL